MRLLKENGVKRGGTTVVDQSFIEYISIVDGSPCPY